MRGVLDTTSFCAHHRRFKFQNINLGTKPPTSPRAMGKIIMQLHGTIVA